MPASSTWRKSTRGWRCTWSTLSAEAQSTMHRSGFVLYFGCLPLNSLLLESPRHRNSSDEDTVFGLPHSTSNTSAVVFVVSWYLYQRLQGSNRSRREGRSRYCNLHLGSERHCRKQNPAKPHSAVETYCEARYTVYANNRRKADIVFGAVPLSKVLGGMGQVDIYTYIFHVLSNVH